METLNHAENCTAVHGTRMRVDFPRFIRNLRMRQESADTMQALNSRWRLLIFLFCEQPRVHKTSLFYALSSSQVSIRCFAAF